MSAIRQTTVANPILPGFHPDPSICRVGDDYYIATSTFEWWPAVRIHRSRDLAHWSHCAYAVTRNSQLDLTGHPDSTGIWAPCLSHAHGQFWLIYTDVRSMYGAYKDTHNYLVTAKDIEGPWSEPIYLNSSGFDPSLFHDDDGRSWLLNQQWNHLPGAKAFDGILLQEFDRERGCLTGPVTNIFQGTSLGVVEGPHLYRRNGYYYLLTAEGGTSYEHAVTLARSKSIMGPYEVMPGNPLLTGHHQDARGLQRAGHASWVQTQAGDWYMAHLCGRPVEWSGSDVDALSYRKGYEGLHCILGRETALQSLTWRADDWPELAGGGVAPRRTFKTALTPDPLPPAVLRDEFDDAQLSPELNALRNPFDESWMSLVERTGYLRLKGRESLMSLFSQSLIARRQQHFDCRVDTALDYEPGNFQQMAGLVAYYNTSNHAYLHVTADAGNGQPVLRLQVNRDGALSEACPALPLSSGRIELRVEFHKATFQFHYCLGQGSWRSFGPPLDAAMLSDEYATQFRDGYPRSFGFTGNFIGLACQDLSGKMKHADFDYMTYEALDAS